MKRLLVAIVFAATSLAAERTPGPMPDGTPFGPIGDADIDHFQEFAFKRAGFDLKAEMARVYGNAGKVDEEALGRLFAFSRQFNTLDNYARTYGQIIYSAFLNLSQTTDVYFKVLGRQSPDVQQRIRDYLYYPYLKVPKENLKELEKERVYQMLFPKGFQFGRNDPVFGK